MGDQAKTIIEAAALVDALGVPAILALLCCLLGYLYFQERRAKDKMTERLLTEVTTNSQQMVRVMTDVEAAIERFSVVMETVRPYLKK